MQRIKLLNNMRNEIFIHTRFFLYGLFSFAIFGLMLEAPNIEIRNVSYKLIIYLALAGGASMVVSCASLRIIYYFYRDLIYGID